MASDYEDEIVDDEDAICGWGAADFDDEFLDGGRRKVLASKAASKGTKQSPQKKLVSLKPGSVLPALHKQKQHQSHGAEPLPEKQNQVTNLDLENQNEHRVHRKFKRKQPHEVRELQHHQNPKPSPRTTSIREENAAIAAIGRQRRMRVVAAAMAANVPRKSGMASVVLASFDVESDDGPEEPEERRPDKCMPSSAPQKQQVKLPRVTEPSTAPAGPIEAPKNIHLPVPLPLLSISPDSGGQETTLAARDKPPPQASRHKRRRHKQKNSLLPSRDVSENWESNFPPFLRRFSSSSKYQAGSSDASTSCEPNSITRAARVPVAPRQVHDTTLQAKEVLPFIHQARKESGYASSTACSGVLNSSEGKQSDKGEQREEEESVEDDNESWTLGYDDPDVIAKSMAGLIQALSTFAAGGKCSKVPKNKKRHAKLQQQQAQLQHQILQNPHPPFRENYDKSSRVRINKGQQESERGTRRRKHRKVRNKQQIRS
ncbi:hypothetical protein PC116_g16285 [Phytophthora cactorum]|uniref:Uncharacterized protein n=2 Tax=Phytophthora cactorum TaxID=29920 RepID=A0A8T1BV03_9STRA|nr:hypothetical protein Pcac1_g12663 [Phytophthora cactorum]KAG2803617.1 hypothetical protein PC112_g19092 [Phytophthora cactorum]KAG2804531.1 hypothetical protein PC111_g18216 [Phytophthora cactorum]KAG2854661.1 hypothetical protein PC113_g13094 [Phytophthora cactorum]KAG2909146.1 hypothetical protein PC115_g13356 [Phytophthora cactorum]